MKGCQRSIYTSAAVTHLPICNSSCNSSCKNSCNSCFISMFCCQDIWIWPDAALPLTSTDSAIRQERHMQTSFRHLCGRWPQVTIALVTTCRDPYLNSFRSSKEIYFTKQKLEIFKCPMPEPVAPTSKHSLTCIAFTISIIFNNDSLSTVMLHPARSIYLGNRTWI